MYRTVTELAERMGDYTLKCNRCDDTYSPSKESSVFILRFGIVPRCVNGHEFSTEHISLDQSTPMANYVGTVVENQRIVP